MKNLKVNKIIIVLAIVLAVILGLTFSVNAFESINPVQVVGNDTSDNSNSNANSNKNSNANKNAISYNNTNVNNNTNLPKTGLTDYSVLFVVIGALAIIGIVAYKKASYYKDI